MLTIHDARLQNIWQQSTVPIVIFCLMVFSGQAAIIYQIYKHEYSTGNFFHFTLLAQSTDYLYGMILNLTQLFTTHLLHALIMLNFNRQLLAIGSCCWITKINAGTVLGHLTFIFCNLV
jgi:uncharacterized membrane protein